MKKIYLVRENLGNDRLCTDEYGEEYYTTDWYDRKLFVTEDYDVAKEYVDKANKMLKDREFISWLRNMGYEAQEKRGINFAEYEQEYYDDQYIRFDITAIEVKEDKPTYPKMIELMLKDYEKYENKETGE